MPPTSLQRTTPQFALGHENTSCPRKNGPKKNHRNKQQLPLPYTSKTAYRDTFLLVTMAHGEEWRIPQKSNTPALFTSRFHRLSLVLQSPVFLSSPLTRTSDPFHLLFFFFLSPATSGDNFTCTWRQHFVFVPVRLFLLFTTRPSFSFSSDLRPTPLANTGFPSHDFGSSFVCGCSLPTTCHQQLPHADSEFPRPVFSVFLCL